MSDFGLEEHQQRRSTPPEMVIAKFLLQVWNTLIKFFNYVESQNEQKPPGRSLRIIFTFNPLFFQLFDC